MSIENITDNILSDAEQIAEVSIKNAEKSSKEIINKAKNKAEAIKKEAADAAVKEAESIKNRQISAGELQRRKLILGAKQDAIKKSFDAALKKLKSMPEDKYIEFLTSEIIKIPYNDGAITLNKHDREKIGGKLVKAVNKKLKAEKFKLSNDTVNAGGGFVLKSGTVIINSTFETILDSVRDDLTSKIADVLFE